MSEAHPITFRLKVFNAWRRGNDAPQPDPKTVGEDIDSICDLARRLERERDEARNAMAQAQGELDLKTLDFERMREQRDQLLKQLAAMESAGAEQARRADENREWSLKVERERDAERALADRLAEAIQNYLVLDENIDATTDELNNAWECLQSSINAWKEARSE